MNDNDIECPRCKSTKYRNPQLKLLVNVCGHSLCEKCIELMFATGAAKCFQCNTALKRGNFKTQLFQDSQVEKDIQVRRRILREFNKKQSDFPNLRAYNDYLEKIETAIFNKANDIDPEDTERLLDELRRPPSDTVIVKQEQKLVKEAPYHHKEYTQLAEGPRVPRLGDNYLKAIRSFSTQEIAGGFTADLAISRALGEAFTNLFTRTCKIDQETHVLVWDTRKMLRPPNKREGQTNAIVVLTKQIP